MSLKLKCIRLDYQIMKSFKFQPNYWTKEIYLIFAELEKLKQKKQFQYV
jgi:hypothetical protein